MLFHQRLHTVRVAASAEWLAEQLTIMTWPLCQGFRLGDLLFLNDAASADGYQEYAVVQVAPGTATDSAAEVAGTQLESIAFFHWDQRGGPMCTPARALQMIRDLQAGRLAGMRQAVQVHLNAPAGHLCPACA